VKVIDTIAMGDEVSQVVFTPDGKRALASKLAAHKVALLEVNGDKVTYTKTDVTVGLWPYNLVVSPDGKTALTADNGGSGSPDGNVDTVSIIDLELKPCVAIFSVGQPAFGRQSVAHGLIRTVVSALPNGPSIKCSKGRYSQFPVQFGPRFGIK
jgi:DNA-binding beta-propeller fold protein YncE